MSVKRWTRWGAALVLALPGLMQAGAVREIPPPEIIRSNTASAVVGSVSSQPLPAGQPDAVMSVEPASREAMPPAGETATATACSTTDQPAVQTVLEPGAAPADALPRAGAGAEPMVSLASSTRRVASTPEERVIESLGLPRKRPIVRGLLPRTEMRARARERLAPHMSRATLSARESMLKAIGLLPRDYELRAAVLDHFPGQVAGLYDLEDGGIGLREDLTAEEKQEVMLHEIVHAIQDQHFDLEQVIPGGLEDEEQARAIRAVVEGQAVWVTTRLSGTSREVVRPRRRARVAEPTPELLALLGADAPAVLPNTLRDSGTQLYQVGAAFVEAFEAKYGASSAVFYAMPASTEQLIHFDRYLAREKPVLVTLDQVAVAAGPRWESLGQMTLGELNVAFWLGEIPGGPVSSGWGGDRLMGFTSSDRTLAVWRTAWDTEEDAAEFQEAARERIRYRFPAARFVRQIPNGFILADGLEAHGVIRLGTEVRVVGGADVDSIEALLQAPW